MKKLRFIITFSLLVLIVNMLFVKSGEVLLSFRSLQVMEMEFVLSVTSGGLFNGLEIALRFLCIILSSMLFVVTTQPSRFAYSLMRSGIPYRYGFALVIALRFVPLFDMEATTVQRAQKARGLEIDRRGIKQLWQLARYTMVPLLASALSRVDALSRSMDSRGFGISRRRTFLRDTPARPTDWAVSLAFIVFTVILIGIKSYAPELIPEPVLPELLRLAQKQLLLPL